MVRFVDLFAGLGGFHLALKSLGFECVFASEIDEELRALYQKNLNFLPVGDIRAVSVKDIPAHDVLCAGLPCQPFSKAGSQEGFNCPKWGDLFDHVIEVLRVHTPTFILLENVANLKNHDDGRTWLQISNALQDLGYELDAKQLSPHRFGIPQVRDRMFIVGSLNGLNDFEWPNREYSERTSIHSVLDKNPPFSRKIPESVVQNLNVWQKFLELYPADQQLPSFPIWSMEFGADYPYEDATPHALTDKDLQRFHGNFGIQLHGLSQVDAWECLPSHARRSQKRFPHWKVNYIRQNRELYETHRTWLDNWLPEIKRFPPSLQKFEWNCKGEKRSVWEFIIQIRASGVRVKRPLTAPSLVAMTTTQIPIVGWEQRYMTMRECLRLQSMDELAHLPKTLARQMRAIGNAVNVRVVQNVAHALIQQPEKGKYASNGNC